MVINLFGREVYLKKEFILILSPLIVVLIGIIGILITENSGDIVIEHETGIKTEITDGLNGQESTKPTPVKSEKREEEIKVYVVGCIKNPGIVTLKKGQLIDDAVKLAGGITEEADMDSINLVYKLNENVMLRVKPKGEAVPPPAQPQGQNGDKTQIASGFEIITDNGGAVVAGSGGAQEKSGSKVNINTASIDELDTLPGIGKETAKDIISFREKNGSFKAINEIMKVTGIKDSKFGKIKDFITVE